MDFDKRERVVMIGHYFAWSAAILASLPLLFFGCTGAFVASELRKKGEGGQIMIASLAGLAVVAVALWTYHYLARRFLNPDKGRRDFESLRDKSAAGGHSFFMNSSGVAVDKEGKSIVLSEDGVSRVYTPEQVRSWESRLDRSALVGGGGGNMIDRSVHAGQILRVAANAKENTGLFISVADIDHPIWHVRFRKQNEIDRWNEILQQFFKGKMAPL
jgi:hypothetical protein